MATLIVGLPASRCAELRRLLAEITQDIIEATDYGGAVGLLRQGAPRLVICERNLPDGGWRDILEAISGAPAPPLLIVTSPLADERLWAEVLNLGGYDVLCQPFEADGVRRVLRLARDHWLRTSGMRPRALGTCAACAKPRTERRRYRQ